MTKYRYKTWYWGKFTTMKEIKSEGWNLKDFEVYDEELHGWHNSEEYKNALQSNSEKHGDI